MLSWFGKIVDRLFVVVGAFLFSQAPAFLQQYSQRLGGHLTELNHQIGELHRLALRSGKTLPEYIHKFTSSGDVDFSQQGTLMLNMLERYRNLSDAYLNLTQASAWMRPAQFIRHMQWDVVNGTMVDFQPGLTLTPEGIIYALIGMLTGYSFYALLSGAGRRIKRLAHN